MISPRDLSLDDEFNLYANQLTQYFSPEHLHDLAKKCGFVLRDGKLKPHDFVSLCAFLNNHIAENSLTQLCSTLDANRNVSLSTEGLNQRFNSEAVKFLQAVFASLMHQKQQNTVGIPTMYNLDFHRIRILDSTAFRLFYEEKKLAGPFGSGVKIQLEYEWLTGQFLHLAVQSSIENDAAYNKTVLDTIQPNDLILKDLGYFSAHDLLQIHEKNAYYLSRLRSTAVIYVKNEKETHFKNGKVVIGSQFKRIDLKKLMDEMEVGETRELNDVFVGGDKLLQPRVILYKHSKEVAQKRLRAKEKKAKKNGMTQSHRAKALTALNTYITNIPQDRVSKTAIHGIYSLRWQIEILFKTWKSLFKIHEVKKIKTERLQCHIYGTLISLLLSSSITFRMRKLLLRRSKQEVSEYKSIGIVREYLFQIQSSLLDGTLYLKELLKKMFKMIKKNGRKSHRYKKMTVFDILGVIYERNEKKAA
ncbi:IS4 family transposase [Fictibacillus iocasae]|uniref:IS4 family transposase n=1 Tax=Fictibacillus iocasae TaxID=2715437 RepID=A0ABW2NR84_9BACL